MTCTSNASFYDEQDFLVFSLGISGLQLHTDYSKEALKVGFRLRDAAQKKRDLAHSGPIWAVMWSN